MGHHAARNCIHCEHFSHYEDRARASLEGTISRKLVRYPEGEMKPTFQPGTGFPGRLQNHLYRINKRPADVERDTSGTVRGWLKGRHFPEKHSYLQFCRTYRIDAPAAQELLYGPSGRRDPERMERRTPVARPLTQHEASLAALEDRMEALTSDQRQALIGRLEEVSASFRADRSAA